MGYELITLLMISIGGVIIFKNYKQMNKIIIVFLIILLGSNFLLLNKYQSTQSSINAVTWNNFQITRSLLSDIKDNTLMIENEKDLKILQSQLDNIRLQITSIVISSNNATFSKNGIDKDRFNTLVSKLDQLSHRFYSENYEVSNQLRKELVELGELLHKMEGGWGRSGMFGSAKVVADFDDESYSQTIKKIDSIIGFLSVHMSDVKSEIN